MAKPTASQEVVYIQHYLAIISINLWKKNTGHILLVNSSTKQMVLWVDQNSERKTTSFSLKSINPRILAKGF